MSLPIYCIVSSLYNYTTTTAAATGDQRKQVCIPVGMRTARRLTVMSWYRHPPLTPGCTHPLWTVSHLWKHYSSHILRMRVAKSRLLRYKCNLTWWDADDVFSRRRTPRWSPPSARQPPGSRLVLKPSAAANHSEHRKQPRHVTERERKRENAS